MKRRTLIIIIVILALLLVAVPANASSLAVDRAADIRGSSPSEKSFTNGLADIMNTLPEGFHESHFEGSQNQFSCFAVGWAADPDDRSIDLNIRIFSDGVEVAQTVAATFRQDLADAGVCQDGTCNFSVDLWGLISPDEDHLITVQAQDAQTEEWVDLSETPRTLNCFEENVLPEGYHDAAEGIQNQFSCVAEGWTSDPNDRDIDLNVRILSDGVEVAQTVADAFRQDLDEAGVCPGGTCSFSVNLWGLISPDADHSITVRAQDAQTEEWVDLSDTPKILNCFEAQAQTLIVNSTADLGDVIQGNGICETSTPGECTLRAAIMESNANSGTDTISFNIPGEGPYTISPSSGFDFIFDPVIIDGTTQPGFEGTPVIELDGSNAGTDAFGLVIYAGSSTVRGLVINRFAFTGIDLDVNGGNVIQGNYIGTDLTGTIALGNGVNGIAISQGSASNIVGGTAAGEGNLISGNGESGIVIVDAGSVNNVIQGNRIGTDVTGQSGLGNSNDGVLLLAPNNTIGGTTPEARNIISGNQEQGIRVQGSEARGNTVQGNFIGLDSTGTIALGNGTDCCHSGIVMHLGASNNIIGGSVPGAGNVISGNSVDGVTIIDAGTTGNLVAGNFIGTDATGTRGVPNSLNGIDIFDGASDNMVGGTTNGAGNTIAFNNANGVVLAMSSGTGNAILSNSIYSNSALGIELGDDGVTLNDLFDADSGPNDLQNFPVLITTVETWRKGTMIQGALLTTGNMTLRIEFFSSDACDDSGYGEGQTYLGFTEVKANPTGLAKFKVSLQTSPATGAFITATTTDAANNTSEFSRCIQVTP